MSSPRVFRTFATGDIWHAWRIVSSFRKIMAAIKSRQERHRWRWIIKEANEPSITPTEAAPAKSERENQTESVVTLSDVCLSLLDLSPEALPRMVLFYRVYTNVARLLYTTTNELIVVPKAKALLSMGALKIYNRKSFPTFVLRNSIYNVMLHLISRCK